VVVDTSAIIAIVLNEPEAPLLIEALGNASRAAMSAATRVELAAVLARGLSPEDARRAERVVDRAGIEIVPFDANQARIASDAYRTFGRGSGHAANLNLGDCFSYALAIARDEPLLFTGNDFGHTDVRSAMPNSRG